jgi:hypothetical protein
MIRQTAVTSIVRADRGHASACAKAVGAAISRGVGTSGTAKTPSACAWCGAGRQHSARPDGAKMMPLKPNMPRRNVRAASAPSLCHNHRKSLKLRRRVVTQQEFFFPLPLCDRPGCHEPSRKSGRNQAAYCGDACRQAVNRVRDRERKWLQRGTFQGRQARTREYEAARARRRGKPQDLDRPPPSHSWPP